MSGYLYYIAFRGSDGKLTQYHHASGYLGSTSRDLTKRVNEHFSGNGSPLIKAAIEAGLTPRLIAVVPFESEKAARQAERKFKKWHNNRKVLKAMKKLELAVSM
ncbi:GIY-YIG nuclease family protein [Leptolyngbya ohadii]|uniref:GIY-YIG nuclease family protein n=1 Tax=Leptolyngbya ohadii TaxID=1962290 RepID=UPI000B59FE0B|nr:GIY-YIG nuclease family protein [Leptolyngbya ohadii]